MADFWLKLRHEGTDPSSFFYLTQPYLETMAKHFLVDQSRSRRGARGLRPTRVGAKNIADADQAPEETLAAVTDVRSALAALSEVEAEVATLCLIEELSEAEAAASLSLAVHEVSQIKATAIVKLRSRLADQL